MRRTHSEWEKKTEEFFFWDVYNSCLVEFVFLSLSLCLSFSLAIFFFYLFGVIRDDNLVRHINLHAFVYYHYYCYYLLCLCILVDCIFRRLNYPPIYYSLSSTSSSSFQTICMCVCVCVVYLLSSWFSFWFERTRFNCAVVVCLVIACIHWLIKTLPFGSIWFAVAKLTQ